MKAIKQDRPNFLIPACYLFFTLFSHAQITHENLLQEASEHYRLESSQMSENGRWMSSRKVYDTNRDTLMIFDQNKPGQPVAVFAKADETHFLDGDHLLARQGDIATYMDLKTGQETCYAQVKKTVILPGHKFMLEYNAGTGNKITVYSSSAHLLYTLHNVVQSVNDGGITWVVSGKESIGYTYYRIEGGSIRPLLQSKETPAYMMAAPGSRNLVYCTRNEGEGLKVNYWDGRLKKEFSLNPLVAGPFSFAGVQTILDGEKYFVSITLNSEPPAKPWVEIWNGNDPLWEDKLYPRTRKVFYVWYPLENKVEQAGNEESSECVYTGSGDYCFCFNPLKYRNITTYFADTPLDVYTYNFQSRKYTRLGKTGPRPIVSATSRYLLTQADGHWVLYDLPKNRKTEIKQEGLGQPYFTPDEKEVYFDSEKGLWVFSIQKCIMQCLPGTGTYKTRILNSKFESFTNSPICSYQIDPRQPILIKLEDTESLTASYILLNKNKQETLIPFTDNRISEITHNAAYTRFAYIEEDYNLPPRLMNKNVGQNEILVYQSNPNDFAVYNLRKEIISFHDSAGRPLKGTLFYPLHYAAGRKYPMVVHIYQMQRTQFNQYPMVYYSTPNITDGFNLRLLLEEGYFVYFPDIGYGDYGPGKAALDCVNRSLDALSGVSLIDHGKIGLTGHSYGGYETNFIAAHSDRFATYISGSGISDIVASYFSFNYDYGMGNYIRYETGQFHMQKSFKKDMDLYFENNPIHNVDKVNAPVLLWSGKEDGNIVPSQTMSFFIGLQRNGKKAVALFYPAEGHTLMSEKASRDLTLREIQWFNYFLKDEKGVDWIEEEMKKDAL